ncbi:MAG: Hsp20/alpha crystallin family protein [Firmicutes bacterium]|nr:Hsp20/alpha crystallin family protein [Bacillota bacterium]
MFNLVPLSLRSIHRWPDLFSDDFFKTNLDSFKTDISETDKEYVIEAELPGFTKADIEVNYRHGDLSISAKREELSEENNDTYLRKERRTGHVMRTFVFENIDAENIKAEYKDGVLYVNLPKKEVTPAEVRKIEIN